MGNSTSTRPKYISDKLKAKENIYVFGVGSNMSRTKIESRHFAGKKINIKSMEPCRVPGYRLAFNLKGIPPTEPSFGSLDPIEGEEKSRSIVEYKNGECHGSLFCVSSEDYERVFESEGGEKMGYQEIVVCCIPYNSNNPIKAVAYRTQENFRLSTDFPPSLRYMKILREGAAELQLEEPYQKYLQDHPTHEVHSIARSLVVNDCYLSLFLRHTYGLRRLTQLRDEIIYLGLVPSTEKSSLKRFVSFIFTCTILFPGAIVGFILRLVMELTGMTPPRHGFFLKIMRGD